MRAIIVFTLAAFMHASSSNAQTPDQSTRPTPAMAESPTITVLKGLTVPQFEAEMQLFVQALGVSCGFCHERGKFTSDAKPQKVTARHMIEMVQGINTQFFPNYKPGPDESRLGKVTCFTCHQGSTTPKSSVGEAAAGIGLRR
jgi:hypothetical protein